jgi:4'-phosphopantetheinyl transferase
MECEPGHRPSREQVIRESVRMLGVSSGVSGRHGFPPRTHERLLQFRLQARPDVRAWLVACDRPASQSSVDVLTAAERARSERFARAADRSAFVVTRVTLRHLLAGELGLEPRAIRLVEPEHGKPRLCASHPGADIDFSVSHTDGLSVVALARGTLVGADIERCRAVADKVEIARDMFGDDAARAIAALPPPGQDDAFLRLWTAGEAYVKATGAGLALRRGPIPICLDRDGARVAFRRDVAARDACRLDFIDAPAGYVCCLATIERDRMPSAAR